MDIDSTSGSCIVDLGRLHTKERVQAVDPNEGRCLVENCSPTRTMEYYHLIPRKLWRSSSLLSSLEWHWNMRANTLNLDTRRNVFPSRYPFALLRPALLYLQAAGALVHHMFDTGRWLLLPEDAIVQQYYDALHPLLKAATRQQFPNIPDRNNFQYHLIPIKDMEGIAFTRQDATGAPPVYHDFVTHLYPYDTLPVLVSHIHPKFVIVAVGIQLSTSPADRVVALANLFPLLFKIRALYVAWTELVPQNSAEDSSFWPPYKPPDDDDDDEDDESDDPKDKDYNDAVTEKGRYRGGTRKRAREESPTRNPPCTRAANRQHSEADGSEEIRDSDYGAAMTEKGRYPSGYRRRKQNQHKMAGEQLSASGKRKQSCGLSQATVVEHTRKVGKMEWSGDALLSWSSQVLPEEAADLVDVTALKSEM